MASKRERRALNALVDICEMEQERNYASMSKFFDDLFIAFHNFKDTIIPTQIESNYKGIHLNEKYQESDFNRLVDQFYNNQMLHAKYSLQILKDSIKYHKKFTNVSTCDLSKSSLSDCIIVGDLHGSFKDLYYLIQKFGTPGKNYRFIFNGDFVDRGPQQCEVLLTILYAFLLYPNRVFLNRGNHEDLSLNLNKNFAPNFQTDCFLKFGRYGREFFRQSQELFKYLPIATILTNKAGYRAFVIHGGISNRTDLQYIAGDELKRYEFSSVTAKKYEDSNKQKSVEQLSDLMWSDPIRKKGINNKTPYVGCYKNTKRGIGWMFGEDTSQQFCKKYGFNTIVRSHEVRNQGWSRDQQNCFTVFSSSNYCHGTNRAAVFILNQNNKFLEYHMFKTEYTDSGGSFQKHKEHLLATFKSYLNREYSLLNKKFEQLDTRKTGWIKTLDWARIVANHISMNHNLISAKHLIILKKDLLKCDDKLGLVKYKDMFNNIYIKNSGRKIFQFLDSIFALIDQDQDGQISRAEAKRAIKKMNSMLGTNYDTSFMSKMDLNRDGLIDMNDFKTGFTKAFSLSLNLKEL